MMSKEGLILWLCGAVFFIMGLSSGVLMLTHNISPETGDIIIKLSSIPLIIGLGYMIHTLYRMHNIA
jgi:hypothetical protein